MVLLTDSSNIGLVALIAAFFFVFIIIGIAIYVYNGFVLMTIAKKLKNPRPWLAWIPVANFFLLPQLAGQAWQYGFFIFLPLVNIVFLIYWFWHILEKRKYAGALSLLILIPYLGVIAWLITIGIVAWHDKE